MTREELLQTIPQVDALLREPALRPLLERHGRAAVTGAARAEAAALRRSILEGRVGLPVPPRAVCEAVGERLARECAPPLRRVLNATGVALHTNLGRAPLAKEALRAVREAAGGYCNLEYDLAAGGRGGRGALCEPLLCALCGCEAALVVNNNAAALLLALSVLARGKEIPVSRGELVEIGDGFRVPDIMAESGGRVREVGSTNRTRLRDYEQALDTGDAGLLLKVHTSNYKLVGFTEQVGIRELSALARARGLPLVCDLGSGALLEAREYPFTGEPTVPEALRDGADLVCFSGDKLLGGPQAGILLGRRELVERLRRSPLARALRIDKLSLAALAATLALYRDGRAKRRVPVLGMLCAKPRELCEKARLLLSLLEKAGARGGFEVVPCARPVGGGSAPGQLLDGFAVAVKPGRGGARGLHARLRAGEPPLVARVFDGRLLLDVSTLAGDELETAARAVAAAMEEEA